MASKSSKTIKMTDETLEKLNKVIEESGKTGEEFIRDVLIDISAKRIKDESNPSVSPELRKHFQSDLAKMKTAVNSIMSTFISQMENLSVERDSWEKLLNHEIQSRKEQIQDFEVKYRMLSDKYVALQKEVQENDRELENAVKTRILAESLLREKENVIESKTARLHEFEGKIKELNKAVESSSALSAENKELKETVERLQQEKIRSDENWKIDLERALLKKEREMLEEIRKASEYAEQFYSNGLKQLKEEFVESLKADKKPSRKTKAAAGRKTKQTS